MSTSYVPEFCSPTQINEGMEALLTTLGVQAADELQIMSILIEGGKVHLAIIPGNKKGDAIVLGLETAPLIEATIRVGEPAFEDQRR